MQGDTGAMTTETTVNGIKDQNKNTIPIRELNKEAIITKNQLRNTINTIKKVIAKIIIADNNTHQIIQVKMV
jgi:hypothetical protein